MIQLSLLQLSDIEVLNDDESGQIVYRRALFDPQQTQKWFEQLRDGVAWRSESRPMYDRVVDVPRLVGSFALDAPNVPQPIRDMRPAVEQVCGVSFLSAGLNFYRDGTTASHRMAITSSAKWTRRRSRSSAWARRGV